MKVFAYRSALYRWNINFMLPKVVKHNEAHELFMITYGRGRRSTVLLEMCSISTNGEQASPAQTFQFIGCYFSYNN